MRVLDLFSGIGGFTLGLQRAGMQTVAFCEIDPFCRKILAKNFPGKVIYDDVRTLTAAHLMADAMLERRNGRFTNAKCKARSSARTEACGIDLICGGFPCQDISVAGKGAGIGGERSGLWSEYARIIGEVRPRYVIVENVAALLGRGLARVLGDLAALGFDAEWHCIPASAVGAPHRRDRIWIVAYTARNVRSEQAESGTERKRIGQGGQSILGDANGSRLSLSWSQPIETYWREAGGEFAAADWWSVEPDVGRVAHGVPARVDRLRSLGNAVVPQIPEIIGKAIISYDRTRR